MGSVTNLTDALAAAYTGYDAVFDFAIIHPEDWRAALREVALVVRAVSASTSHRPETAYLSAAV